MVTHLVYDALNRLVSRCEDVGSENVCTAYGYDVFGNRDTIVDPEGVTTTTDYNGFGLPTLVTQDDGGTGHRGVGSTYLQAKTSFSYDNAFNTTRVKNGNGYDTWYTFDDNYRVVQEIYADGKYVAYSYDGRGNIYTQRLQSGEVITHTYDGAGRLTTKEIGAAGWQTYTYDAAGRLLTAEETMNGHTTRLAYAYNALGDVVSTTQTVSGTAWTVQYAYDYSGGVYTVTYPSGAERRYELDALGRLGTVKDGGSTIAGYTYHDLDSYTTIAYGNGLTTRVEYDTLGRTTRVKTTRDSSIVAQHAYGYDKAGNRTWMQRQHKQNDQYDVYEYDALYQLTKAWYGVASDDPGGTPHNEYALDLLGNRLWVRESGTITATYNPTDGVKLTNPMNRYGQVNGTSLTYDARGNTMNDGVYAYGYDLLNRQVSANGATYLYDAFGRRVAKILGGATTYYVYDIYGRVLEERDGDNSLAARYTYGSGIDEVLTMEQDGNTYYYHRDALGSITEVTDDDGDLGSPRILIVPKM